MGVSEFSYGYPSRACIGLIWQRESVKGYEAVGQLKLDLREESLSCSQLFHEPVGNIGSSVETLVAMTDAIEHCSFGRIDGFLV